MKFVGDAVGANFPERKDIFESAKKIGWQLVRTTLIKK